MEHENVQAPAVDNSEIVKPMSPFARRVDHHTYQYTMLKKACELVVVHWLGAPAPLLCISSEV